MKILILLALQLAYAGDFDAKMKAWLNREEMDLVVEFGLPQHSSEFEGDKLLRWNSKGCDMIFRIRERKVTGYLWRGECDAD